MHHDRKAADQLDLDELIVAAVGDERDPYPGFAQHRRDEPVMHNEHFAGAPVYTVYRYADVARVLRESDTFSSRVYAPAIGLVLGPSILQMDGAQHQRQRSLIGGAFRRTLLADWERTLMEPAVHELLDRFDGDGRTDLVRQFTLQYPIRIIAKILGIPDEDYMRFIRLSVQLISIATDIERGLEASRQLREYFAEIIAARRAEARDDVISTLVHAQVDGEPLPDDEIYGFLRLLLPAGAETTYRLLGNLLFALLTNVDQLEQVRSDRSLLPRAIEEALRWEAPVQYISREATTEVEVAGFTIPAGGHVSCALGSANHDETVFDDPERYDLNAERAPHLAFAEGPHRCLGEHLATLETTVAMNVLLDRFPSLRFDPGETDPHIAGVPFRSPTALPVTF